jgi:hypothetical protein
MPKISFEHTSQLAPQDAFEKIKNFFESETELKKYDATLKCQFNESQRSGQAKGSQFSADMKVQDKGAGCVVTLNIDLPFLLSPFKGKIQESVQRKLKKYLG